MRGKTRPIVYIAAPYTLGDTFLNIRQVIDVANTLWDKGYLPFIPHLTAFWHLVYPKDYEEWLEYGQEWVRHCNILLRLPGESPGADKEVKLAKTLGIPVYYDINDLPRIDQ